MAIATGGSGGNIVGIGFAGGKGGEATATANSSTSAGPSTANATATGGDGGSRDVDSFATDGQGGAGGDATATANATAHGGSSATATATAFGGAGGAGGASGVDGVNGAANATASAVTQRGSGEAQSTAETSLGRVSLIQSSATAPAGSTATTNTIAQGGGSGQVFSNPGQTAYAFSVGLPDKDYATTLIGGASNVGGALLGPGDIVFGTAILGANYAPDGAGESHTYSASAMFDVNYRGDLQLGLIDNLQDGFAGGLGFQSIEFYVMSNRSEILDRSFTDLLSAEAFFNDGVTNLGSYSGTADLTFGYNLVADGAGGFGVDLAFGGAVPEPSTWAMLLIGLAGLGFAGYRRARAGRTTGAA